MNKKEIKERYEQAKKAYAKIGVDTDGAIEKASSIPLSIHCWQGDNIKGFMHPDETLSGGIQVTGEYPYGARNPKELREDLHQVFSMIPGKKKLNLHAIYADTDDSIDVNEIEPKHFSRWVDFAKEEQIGLDFNPTLFSHPKAASGFTLSSNKKEIRDFWIDHCIRSRKIGEYFGKELNQKSVVNIWIPDGFKDYPIDRLSPRKRLAESLDRIYESDIDESHVLDTVESKLFGIGTEAYTTGSYDFYLSYVLDRNKTICLDLGHFHQTEDVFDKIPSVMVFSDELLLHISRPMRWDSDHVVLMDDVLQRTMETLVRNDLLDRTHLALDFFDGSISPLFAWTIGSRNAQKALLRALLEPVKMLKDMENDGDYNHRLTWTEELKTYPFADVFAYYCLKNDVPYDDAWIKQLDEYEKRNLQERRQ